MSNKIKFDVIIPSVKLFSGVQDYLDSGPLLNFLPLVHKTGIEWLVDDLLKNKELINKICIVCMDDLKDRYDSLLSNDERKNYLDYAKVQPYDFHGVFPAVRRGVSHICGESKSDIPSNPILVACGDTLVLDAFWNVIFDSAVKLYKSKKNKSWCILNFVDCTTEISKQIISEDDNIFLEQNREGICLLQKANLSKSYDEIKKEDEIIAKVHKCNGSHIYDLIDGPLYPSISFANLLKRNMLFLKMVGVIAISQKGWKALCDVREEAMHLFRLRSFIDILQFAIVKKKIDVQINFASSVNGHRPEHYWFDINYPFELIKANTYLSNYIKDWYLNKNEQGHLDNPNLNNYEVILSHKEAIQFKKKHSSFIGFKKISEYDEKKHPWLSNKAEFLGAIIKPINAKSIKIAEGASIQGVCVIDDRCSISEHAVVKDSILKGNVNVESKTLIDSSIILEKSRIMPFSAISHSIIGKEVVIGGHVHIAYNKLVNVVASPKSDYIFPENERYFTEVSEVRHKNHFGAIIGDNTKIGMGVVIEPGRKIGNRCIIAPRMNVRHNILSDRTIKIEEEA